MRSESPSERRRARTQRHPRIEWARAIERSRDQPEETGSMAGDGALNGH